MLLFGYIIYKLRLTLLLTQWIQRKVFPWKLKEMGDQILFVLDFFSASVAHIYIEGNNVADAMANLGASKHNLCYLRSQDLPPQTFKAWVGGALHLPNWRFQR